MKKNKKGFLQQDDDKRLKLIFFEAVCLVESSIDEGDPRHTTLCVSFSIDRAFPSHPSERMASIGMIHIELPYILSAIHHHQSTTVTKRQSMSLILVTLFFDLSSKKIFFFGR